MQLSGNAPPVDDRPVNPPVQKAKAGALAPLSPIYQQPKQLSGVFLVMMLSMSTGGSCV
jgi:hypothetical protein